MNVASVASAGMATGEMPGVGIEVRPPIAGLKSNVRNFIRSFNVLFAKTDLNLDVRHTMNDDVRELVNAMLAIAYAAVLLVLGELYITSRSTELPVFPSSKACRCRRRSMRCHARP